MEKKVLITRDSTSDLPADILEKYKSFFAIVVNPSSLNLVITDKGIENIEQEKDGPVKVYKLAPDSENNE